MPRRRIEEGAEDEDLTALKKTKLNDNNKVLNKTATTSFVVVVDDHELSSCCSSNGSTSSSCSDKLRGGTVVMDSTVRTNEEVESRRDPTRNERMPSQAELDEFFASAEKNMHKHYAEKYNFDFVKEKPLEGKYEWEKVKP